MSIKTILPEILSDKMDDGSLLDDAEPRFTRRVTDKVLAAFTHAYALDELELAGALWTALEIADKVSQKEDSRRRPNQATELAEYWVRLVDARRHYQQAMAEDSEADDRETERSRREVKAAYAAWLAQFKDQ